MKDISDERIDRWDIGHVGRAHGTSGQDDVGRVETNFSTMSVYDNGPFLCLGVVCRARQESRVRPDEELLGSGVKLQEVAVEIECKLHNMISTSVMPRAHLSLSRGV